MDSTTQPTSETLLLKALMSIHGMLGDQYECSDRVMCEKVMAVAQAALTDHWKRKAA
jgi:hypothetical protein